MAAASVAVPKCHVRETIARIFSALIPLLLSSVNNAFLVGSVAHRAE